MDAESLKVVYGLVGAVLGGGITHILKRYTESVDSQEKMLPVLAKSIETINNAVGSINSAIEELYKCRNDHNEKLSVIETIHKLKGCDQPMKGVD